MGYIYSQCTSKTDCTYQGFTNVKQTTLSLSASKLCSAGASALGHVGTMKVKSNGKIALKKTVTFQDFTTYKNETVTVEFNGKLKKSKSVKGTLKITTTASDCVDDTGKSNDVNLKYKGAYYGG
jgi:hypothetical protein